MKKYRKFNVFKTQLNQYWLYNQTNTVKGIRTSNNFDLMYHMTCFGSKVASLLERASGVPQGGIIYSNY